MSRQRNDDQSITNQITTMMILPQTQTLTVPSSCSPK